MSGAFWSGRRVLVTGGHGFLGRHVLAALRARGVAPGDVLAPTSGEADLRDPAVCADVVRGRDLVIHLAARTGGIGLHAERPGEVLYDTALMGLLLMEASRRAGVTRFVGVGTTCSYPNKLPAPFREDALFDGPSDAVTGAYGLAKKLLLVQGQTYGRQYGLDTAHLILVNLYGPHDHFDDARSHVVAALVRRLVAAADAGLPEVTVWGTGRATREFLYVADAAEAVLLACERDTGGSPINVGTGVETPIRDLAAMIAKSADFRGALRWDPSRPDGTPRRVVDVTRARELLGFAARTPLAEGIAATVAWYRTRR